MNTWTTQRDRVSELSEWIREIGEEVNKECIKKNGNGNIKIFIFFLKYLFSYVVLCSTSFTSYYFLYSQLQNEDKL